MIAIGTRVQIQTMSMGALPCTVVAYSKKLNNPIVEFDDGAIAQYPETILQPVPEPLPLTPEVF